MIVGSGPAGYTAAVNQWAREGLGFKTDRGYNSIGNVGNPMSHYAYGLGWGGASAGPLHLFKMAAAEGGLVFRSYDPFALALKVGVVGRWQRKAISVLFGLNLFAGLSERDAGNKEAFTR